jgi:hypothetical protein
MGKNVAYSAITWHQSYKEQELDTNTNICGHEVDEEVQYIRLANNKALSVSIATVLHSIDPQPQYVRFANCGHYLKKQGRLIVTHYCQNKLCPTCQRKKSNKVGRKYIKSMQELSKAKRQSWYHVTLTRPRVNTDDPLVLRSEHKINKSFMRRTIDKANKRSRRKGIGMIMHGIYSNEDTFKTGSGFHPHIHIAILGYANAKYIVHEWIDYWGMDAVTGKTYVSQDAQHINRITDIQKGLLEVIKYPIKTIEVDMHTDPYAIYIMSQASRYQKQFSKFGNIYADETEDRQETDKFDPDMPFDSYFFFKDNWFKRTRSDFGFGEPLIKKQGEILTLKTRKQIIRLNPYLKIYNTS